MDARACWLCLATDHVAPYALTTAFPGNGTGKLSVSIFCCHACAWNIAQNGGSKHLRPMNGPGRKPSPTAEAWANIASDDELFSLLDQPGKPIIEHVGMIVRGIATADELSKEKKRRKVITSPVILPAPQRMLPPTAVDVTARAAISVQTTVGIDWLRRNLATELEAANVAYAVLALNGGEEPLAF